MRTLGIITARSGSKGIKDKNIRLLNGKPLMAYAIESALESQYIDEVMVSTDSREYANIARKYGACVPFLRSAENSGDASKSLDAILEALDGYERLGRHYDAVIVLQPTSPLRTTENIDGAFRLFYDKKADSIVSVCECGHSPLLSNVLPEDLNLFHFVHEKNLERRQELKKHYRLNGAIYISKVEALRSLQSFYGRNSYAYIMGRMESVDIDTELDFSYASFLLSHKMERT